MFHLICSRCVLSCSAVVYNDANFYATVNMKNSQKFYITIHMNDTCAPDCRLFEHITYVHVLTSLCSITVHIFIHC